MGGTSGQFYRALTGDEIPLALQHESITMGDFPLRAECG